MAAAVEAEVEEATMTAETTTTVMTTRMAVDEEATKTAVEVAGTTAEVDMVVKVATHRHHPTLHLHSLVATFLHRQEVLDSSLPHLQDGCLLPV